MKYLRKLFTRLFATVRSCANDLAIANALGGSDAVFEVQQDGSFFVPFGKYSHEKGLQIFDKAAAEALQSAANSLLTKAAGIPIYAGHPDVKGRPDTNPAAPAYGWIDGIEIENDGAKFLHRLNKRGQEAVENADFRYYSPHWLLKKVAGGLSPVRLLSMGLTNNPRIPVPAIANDQDHQEKTMTEAQLRAIGLEPGATEDAINARLAELGSAANDLVTVTARAVQAEADLVAARTATTAANDRATAAREILVDATLERAVLAGRITEADRAPRRVELLAIENDSDLTGKLTDLDKAEKALPGSQTGDLTGAREVAAAENDATSRSVKRQKVVSDELAGIANDYPGMSSQARYDMAWQRAQRKHPTLFTAQANA